MTIGIAAICDAIPNTWPKIILCADRLVSAGIQFESGTSKIVKITDFCYAISSSNDTSTSDLVLEKVIERSQHDSNIVDTKDIVRVLKEECINHKKECLDRDVLLKYNVMTEKLKINADPVLKMAKGEVDNYDYPLECEFIVAGLEVAKKAHIYRVDQDGGCRLDDFLGYTTIGSGSGLAFLEMTRYIYARESTPAFAIPLVYLAKRTAERAQGVGRATDFGVLYFSGDPKKETPSYVDLAKADFLKTLDATYNTIRDNYYSTLDNLFKEVSRVLYPEKSKS